MNGNVFQNTPLQNRQPLKDEGNYQYIAWAMVLLFPVFFLLGFAAAHIPYIFWDFQEGSGTEPVWFGLLCVACFMAVQAFPVWVMWKFGHKAVEAGHPSGIYAYWVGAFWGIGLLALMVISALINQMPVKP